MSILERLLAGLTQEIIKRVNFISGQFRFLEKYPQELLYLLGIYQQYYPKPVPEIAEEIEAMDLEFFILDMQKMIGSLQTGTDRIISIVRSLRIPEILEDRYSLGQLVPWVQSEMNNPFCFIHGNLIHINTYTKDLLNLLGMYQQYYSEPVPEIADNIEALDVLKEEMEKISGSIQAVIYRMNDILQDMRNLLILDRANLNIEDKDIHEEIENTLVTEKLKHDLECTDIQVIKDYGKLPKVECYSYHMTRFFEHIIMNAIEALVRENGSFRMENGLSTRPTITIRTEVSDRVTIAIADNGPGMSEEVQQKIFDPFFTTKPLCSNTGLGLSISYAIVVEKHGGQLKCISAPGEGAEFIIEIPLSQNKN